MSYDMDDDNAFGGGAYADGAAFFGDDDDGLDGGATREEISKMTPAQQAARLKKIAAKAFRTRNAKRKAEGLPPLKRRPKKASAKKAPKKAASSSSGAKPLKATSGLSPHARKIFSGARRTLKAVVGVRKTSRNAKISATLFAQSILGSIAEMAPSLVGVRKTLSSEDVVTGFKLWATSHPSMASQHVDYVVKSVLLGIVPKAKATVAAGCGLKGPKRAKGAERPWKFSLSSIRSILTTNGSMRMGRCAALTASLALEQVVAYFIKKAIGGLETGKKLTGRYLDEHLSDIFAGDVLAQKRQDIKDVIDPPKAAPKAKKAAPKKKKAAPKKKKAAPKKK